MQNSKLLPISILAGSVLIGVALLWHARTGRYQFAPSDPPGVIWVLDTWTGEVKVQAG